MSVIIVRPIQAVLISVMQQIRSEFIEKAEEIIKLDIRYSSLRPSFFGTIDIRNLRLINNKGSPHDALLSISRVRIHFSIRELLLRKKTFIHTFQIDRPVLSIDTKRDKDVLEHLSSLINNQYTAIEVLQLISEFLPENADYLIRQCSLSFTNGDTVYKADEMNLNAWGNNGDIFLAGRFNAQVSHSGITVKTNIGIDASFSDNFEDSKADITTYSLSISGKDSINPLVTVSPFNAAVLLKDRILSLTPGITLDKKEDNLNYSFSYNLETGDLYANFNLDNFKPAEKLAFSDQLKDARHLLQLQITGNSWFKQNDGSMEYSVNFSGINRSSRIADNFLINVHGNDKSVTLNNILINSNTTANFFQGRFQANGSIEFANDTNSFIKPRGTISFNNFSLTGKESVNAFFNVTNHNREIRISSSKADIAKTQLNDLNITIYPTQRDLAVSLSGIFNNDGAIHLDSVINSTAGASPGGLEASLVFDSVSFYDISELFRPYTDYFNLPLSAPLKETLLDAEIFLSTDFNSIVFNAPNIKIKNNETIGTLSVSGTDRQVTISEGIFNIGDNDFNLSANLVYANPMDLVFNFNASYLDLSWQLEGQIFDKTTLIIRDPNGLNMYGSLSNNKTASGYIEGINFPILADFLNERTNQIRTQIVYLNFYISLRYSSIDSWTLNVNHFTAREQNALNNAEFLRISGEANQDGASFRDFVFSDFVGMLAGSVDFSWDNDFSYIEFLVNITDGRDGGETYFLEGVLKDENININASINKMHFNRFIKETRPMLLSADASFSWDSIDSFNADVNISSFDAKMGDNSIKASGKINISDDEIRLNNLYFDFGELKTIVPLFQLNRTKGNTSGYADVNGIIFERKIDTNISIEANFGQTDSWLDLGRALNVFNGVFRIDNMKYDGDDFESIVFLVSGDRGALSVSGGIRNMLRLEMDRDGNFFAGLSAPFPIRCSIMGTFKNGYIDARCNNFFVDLAAIWSSLVSVPEFIISAGYITGSVDIRGPLLNPEFFGTGRGSSFRFKVPDYIPEDLRPVPFNVQAEGNVMTFGPVVAGVGNGGGIVNGYFIFENWIPKNIGIEISVPHDIPIPYDFNVYGFLASGDASGDLYLTVDLINEILEVGGDLVTTNANLGINMEEIMEDRDFASEVVKLYAIVDFKITAGPTVEFIWPSTSPILRINPEMGTAIHITADNRAGQYSFNSNVRIRSGEIYYMDRSFYIRQGSIVFNENENKFDPIFSARAEIRDRAESGPVTLSLVVENQPLLSFEPRFEARPSLTQLEIYSILGQNVNSIQGYENADMRFLITSTTDILTQVIAASDLFGQFTFLRQFERHVRDFLGLDMFTIRTRILQNAVVTGATGGFARTDGRNVARGNRFGNYFDNTTVFVGKYIGKDMFIQGMLTMRYDENSALFGGLRFEPDIGIELQSPFINIRWDFFPYNPQNWWVNDNSITLSWSKSF